jgi:hypothetical protein
VRAGGSKNDKAYGTVPGGVRWVKNQQRFSTALMMLRRRPFCDPPVASCPIHSPCVHGGHRRLTQRRSADLPLASAAAGIGGVRPSPSVPDSALARARRRYWVRP